jgi:hypothetical protein
VTNPEEPWWSDKREYLTRGKYLVDDAGHPKFFVSTSVDPEYPYQLTAVDGQLPPTIRLDAEAAVDTARADAKIGDLSKTSELGIDHQRYRVLTLTEAVGGLSPGRYLVSESGKVAYRAKRISKFDAPKAQLFALIIDGTLGGDLPWGLVLIGVFIAIILELVGVASLPFAVGLYLPVETSAAIFVGGSVRWLVDRKRRGESASSAEFSPGMLMASGLIAGGAIVGLLLTIDAVKALDMSSSFGLGHEAWFPLIPFVLMASLLYWIGTRRDS